MVLGDGRGTLAHGMVVAVGKDTLTVRVHRWESVPRPSPTVTVAQALVKGDRGELAVELATEAGADAVLPWKAARCVVRWDDGPRGARALDRWRSTAAAAAKQSRRAWLPEVGEPLNTAQLAARCAELSATGLALVLHESATDGLSGALAAAPEVTELLLVVGPEGGVAEDELDALAGAGARPVRLGPEVLRASTAAAVALGALGVLTPRW